MSACSIADKTKLVHLHVHSSKAHVGLSVSLQIWGSIPHQGDYLSTILRNHHQQYPLDSQLKQGIATNYWEYLFQVDRVSREVGEELELKVEGAKFGQHRTASRCPTPILDSATAHNTHEKKRTPSNITSNIPHNPYIQLHLYVVHSISQSKI